MAVVLFGAVIVVVVVVGVELVVSFVSSVMDGIDVSSAPSRSAVGSAREGLEEVLVRPALARLRNPLLLLLVLSVSVV